jgi:hypothetical protein
MSGRRPATGMPEATTPHPNAHIGGNHVMGFNSSVMADKLGRDMRSIV